MSELIPIVNENDKILYYKERDKVNNNEIFRISSLWIENSQDMVLLARRSLLKKHNPGTWSGAVAGTLEKGETYKSNIVKEAKEEIGLDISKLKLKKIGKTLAVGERRFFAQRYKLIIDKKITDFKIDKKEVSELRWIKKSDLKKEVKLHPEMFSDAFPNALQAFLK